MSMPDFDHLGLIPFDARTREIGALLTVYRSSWVGLPTSVSDFILLGISLSLRVFARLGSFLAFFSSSRIGSPIWVFVIVRLGLFLRCEDLRDYVWR